MSHVGKRGTAEVVRIWTVWKRSGSSNGQLDSYHPFFEGAQLRNKDINGSPRSDGVESILAVRFDDGTYFTNAFSLVSFAGSPEDEKREQVRREALAKLTEDERRVLGLL